MLPYTRSTRKADIEPLRYKKCSPDYHESLHNPNICSSDTLYKIAVNTSITSSVGLSPKAWHARMGRDLGVVSAVCSLVLLQLDGHHMGKTLGEGLQVPEKIREHRSLFHDELVVDSVTRYLNPDQATTRDRG